MSQLRPALANISKPLDMEPEDTSLESTVHTNEDAASRQQSGSEKVPRQLNKTKELSRTIQLLNINLSQEKLNYRQHKSRLYVQD